MYHAKNLSAKLGCKIYLKREDLVHGGAHKTNNAICQGLLARYMGKARLIAETEAGMHGAATAMMGALFGIKTEIYMGLEPLLDHTTTQRLYATFSKSLAKKLELKY